MIQDLHSHTYYSFCGKDRPEDIVEAAIDGGVECFGISDHNYGIGLGRNCVCQSENHALFCDYEGTLRRYFDHIDLIRQKYADRIRILRGIEICTETRKPWTALPAGVDVSFFDYCLVEDLRNPENSIAKGDLFSFAKRCGCPVGVAHTDLFAFLEEQNQDPAAYFRQMAKQKIFWELNVNYDGIHNYREHEYVAQFFADAKQQSIVRESGVRLSVGFDGHRVEEYRADRVREACRKISELGILLAFEE